jgi:hypothetical protein
MMQDPNRETLTLKIDDRELRLVPMIIEGYQLEINGRKVTSFLSKTPPLMRAVATLEAEGSFGVGELELASEVRKWTVTGPVKSTPAEKG